MSPQPESPGEKPGEPTRATGKVKDRVAAIAAKMMMVGRRHPCGFVTRRLSRQGDLADPIFFQKKLDRAINRGEVRGGHARPDGFQNLLGA